jgi:phospholipid/cholesterol/gamma-HCH transport system substrate-binding protein
MVLATVIVTAILVVYFDGVPAVVDRPYTLYLDFPEGAPGVGIGTPVRKNGIRIGQVSDVQFAEDVDPRYTGAIITIHLDPNRKIHHNEVPQINSPLFGVGGDTTIEFVRTRAAGNNSTIQPFQQAPPQPASPPPGDGSDVYKPGEMLEGRLNSGPLDMIGNMEGSLSEAMSSIARTSDQIGQLSQRVNDLIRNNDEQIVRIVGKAEIAIDNISSTVKNANDLIGDPVLRQNIFKAANDLPQVLAQMNEAISTVHQTFDTADRNLRNIEGLTKPLGERGPQLVANIEQATQNVGAMVEDLQRFVDAFNNSQGTLGKLINDPKLHDQLVETMCKVNEILQKVEPIVNDARAFSDKLARHPEVLTRGILKPSSGIK